MEKKIIKARIGKCIDLQTNKVEYQLQFKEDGKSYYNGFSVDTFENLHEAEEALILHNQGGRLYRAYVTLGGMSRYFLCKADEGIIPEVR
jgi:hypothetical protein